MAGFVTTAVSATTGTDAVIGSGSGAGFVVLAGFFGLPSGLACTGQSAHAEKSGGSGNLPIWFGDFRQGYVIVDAVKAAVGKALDARRPPPDTFRRTQQQQLTSLGLSSERASRRNG